MASGGAGLFYPFFLMTKLWLESAPLFQITWIRGQEGTMCAGIWHRPVLALPTHFIHPCWQPFIYSHSAVGTGRPNTLPKPRLLLKHDSATTAIQLPTGPGVCVCVYIHKQAALAPRFSTTVSSLLFWSLPSLCQRVWRRDGPQVLETFWQHSSQLANMLLPSATSVSTVQRWSVPLTASSTFYRFFFHSFSDCLICFLLQFWLDSAQRGLNMWDKWERRLCSLTWPSPSPHTHSQCYIIWCLHFLCAPLCSHYPPFIGCNSAAQHQTNSLSM